MNAPPLALSLFPGIGLLDLAFELEGFTVVRGPDVLWGGDIRRFHPPTGKFDGVIGGPPCQMFSSLAHMVRHNGYQPKFGNLMPEFERCVAEAEPQWFLMENVPAAPLPEIGEGGISREQHQDTEAAARARARKRGVSIALGGSGKPKPEVRKGNLNKCVGNNVKSKSSLARLCELQGLLADFLEHVPFTVAAACKMIGNGVPLPMGRALAKAVKETMDYQLTENQPERNQPQ